MAAKQPAAGLTYDTLVSDVIAYLERNDDAFVNEIPRFVLYAEKQIAAEFKTLWETAVVNTNIKAQIPFMALPARTRRVLSVSINGVSLFERSAEYVLMINNEFSAGRPQYWAWYDMNNLLFGPEPNAQYMLQLIYQEQVQPLSQSNQDNLITRDMPQLLLYATMYQAALWEKNPSRQQQWQGMYQQALQALKTEDGARAIDRNTTVSPGA